jgi:LPPG:FO 2-phospho-L-lactate transferase
MSFNHRIVVLSGGVGGAKFAYGLFHALPRGNLTVCVNTGDDFTAFGLAISPDLDTVCYTLAGLANPETGWGLEGESWTILESIRKLGGPAWFKLGDKDLATHLERTRLLAEGHTLSEITDRFCAYWGIQAKIFPMSDQTVRTMVDTRDGGVIPFQEYFVARNCEPVVKGIILEGISDARPASGLIESIRNADAVIIAPSNPLVSIEPILQVPGIRDEIQKKKVIAVSPIVGGKTIKGPLAKMYAELGKEASAATVAEGYHGLINGFVMDTLDENLVAMVNQWDIITMITDIVMKSVRDRVRLAEGILDFLDHMISG